MTTHELKTWPSYFEAVVSGEKTFELRVHDRDFAVCDVLVLQEWDPTPTALGAPVGYTGREHRVVVTYMLSIGNRDSCEFVGDRDFCVMAIREERV